MPLVSTLPAIFVVPSPLTDDTRFPPVRINVPALEIPSTAVTLLASVVKLAVLAMVTDFCEIVLPDVFVTPPVIFVTPVLVVWESVIFDTKLPLLRFNVPWLSTSSVADNLSAPLQEKLLVLLKSVREERKNIRFIFSTEVNIEDKIEQGLFLQDLYQLMSTVPVNMIPLRQRKDDILPIADYYFAKLSAVSGVGFKGFSEEALEVMKNYFWPGNIAELKNAVERAFIVGEPPYIKTSDMAIALADSLPSVETGEDKSLKTAVNAFKKSYVTKILEENNWNQTKTAKVLGIQRTYVIRLIDELQIRK